MVNGHREPDARTPSLADALIPLITLAVLIAGLLALFGLDALNGPIQVALMLCCAEAALIAMQNGHLFTAVQEAGKGVVSTLLYLPYAGVLLRQPRAERPVRNHRLQDRESRTH